jgi:tetratricopeptide (TPR) repeat protein
MNVRLRLGFLALAVAGAAAIPVQPQVVSAQEASARFRVLVPEIQGQEGADRRFGGRLANELRSLINQMATHQPIEGRELNQALRRFDLKMENLDCTRARQLANLIDAKVVFCGTYSAEGDNLRVEGQFVTSEGEEFIVEPVVVPARGGQRDAAVHFFEALQVESERQRFSQFCGDYYSSQVYDQALSMCDQAIAINPRAVSSRFIRAMSLREMDRLEESLEEFLEVLELDPLHEDAMQNAGYLSALLNRPDDARKYYRQYLELNPTNAQVRMRVAYDLATAGDALGAMQLIEAGMEIDPENVDLLKQHGSFAFTAGAEVAGESAQDLPPEAVELYRKALSSLEKVYAAEGAEMNTTFLLNMVRAHINIREFQVAADLARRGLETHPEEAALWSFYADALQRAGNLDEAIQALERLKEISPDYPNVAVRQGNWLLQERRTEEALPLLREAVQRGEQTADAVAMIVFREGYERGVQAENWSFGVQMFTQAKQFEVTDQMRQQLDFWHGFALLRLGIQQQEPATLETARATLPRFQEAQRLLQASGGYAQRNNMEATRQQLLGNVQTFIEIQDAIIRRGR